MKDQGHPLRLARVSAGRSQSELSTMSGVARATIAAIEDGRTRQPDDDTLALLAQALASPDLPALIRAYRPDPQARLTPQGALAVSLPPAAIADLDSFRTWRKRLAPSVLGFSALTGVHRTIVGDYERSLPGEPMPERIMHACFELGMTAEQVLALSRLPGGGS